MKQINNTGFNYYPKVLPNKAQGIQNPASSKSNVFAQQLKESTDLLQKQNNSTKLKLSSHAKLRLEQRGIILDNEKMSRLQEGMEKAKDKGSQESLLLMEGVAYVVSVKNETIITAMAQEGMSEHVITNIDSAVLL